MSDAAPSYAPPSYANGGSETALIGETIGQHFDRTVARWGDRPGLIVHQQSIQWSWSELGSRVDAFAQTAEEPDAGDPHLTAIAHFANSFAGKLIRSAHSHRPSRNSLLG